MAESDFAKKQAIFLKDLLKKMVPISVKNFLLVIFQRMKAENMPKSIIVFTRFVQRW